MLNVPFIVLQMQFLEKLAELLQKRSLCKYYYYYYYYLHSTYINTEKQLTQRYRL